MKKYLLYLLKLFVLFTILISLVMTFVLVVLGPYNVKDILPGIPAAIVGALVICVLLSCLDLYDFEVVAKVQNIPLSWVIEAQYSLEWNQDKMYSREDFRGEFEKEMKQKGLEYQPWEGYPE